MMQVRGNPRGSPPCVSSPPLLTLRFLVETSTMALLSRRVQLVIYLLIASLSERPEASVTKEHEVCYIQELSRSSGPSRPAIGSDGKLRPMSAQKILGKEPTVFIFQMQAFNYLDSSKQWEGENNHVVYFSWSWTSNEVIGVKMIFKTQCKYRALLVMISDPEENVETATQLPRSSTSGLISAKCGSHPLQWLIVAILLWITYPSCFCFHNTHLIYFQHSKCI